MAHQLIQKITITNLARNLASVIDQVRVAHKPMTITRGNQDIAQIVPVQNSTVQLSDLAILINKNQLSQHQKQSFADDLSTIRQASALPDSDWDS